MKTGTKIALSIITIAVGTAGYIIYYRYSNQLPKLVNVSGKLLTVKYKGKETIIDAEDLSSKGQSLKLGKWSLAPYYGNKSDKSSLMGLNVLDSEGRSRTVLYYK